MANQIVALVSNSAMSIDVDNGFRDDFIETGPEYSERSEQIVSL